MSTKTPEQIITEKPAFSISGGLAFVSFAAWLLVIIGLIIAAAKTNTSSIPTTITLGVAALLILLLGSTAFAIVKPGTTRVRMFLGNYVGTIRPTGLSMVLPFCTQTTVDVRVNNFETNELKVNDADGNPITIAAIVVWKVKDTALASFAVEDYQEFIHTQAESALRHVAMSFPFDSTDEHTISLRGDTEQVSAKLQAEVSERVALAGLEVVEVRVSSLAYAPEIAQAMLQRQQAGAVIAARELIVEGAVTMVETALDRLEKEDIVILDEERKAQMVSNLLVVLCSDQRATPVVNTGSLYA